MRILHIIVFTLIVIGALNWGLVGLFDFNLVAALFGPDSWFTNFIYILVGLSALVALYTEYALHGSDRVHTDRTHTMQPVHR